MQHINTPQTTQGEHSIRLVLLLIMTTKTLISLRLAKLAWLSLIVLTLIWDGYFSPLNTGRWLLVIKLLPLCLPLRGILQGKRYTYQYSSMLILAYFCEGIMRLFDIHVTSRLFAATEIMLCLIFFATCLYYIKHSKQHIN